MLHRIGVQRLAGNSPDDFAQRLIIDIAVYESRSGRRDGLLLHDQSHGRLISRPRRLQGQIRPETRVVRHQLADGDLLFSIGFEIGPVFPHRVFQPNPALLDQLHDGGGCGNDFGQRRHVEDGVYFHWQVFGDQRPVAEGSPVNHLALVTHQDYSAGTFPLANGLLDQRRNRLQAALGCFLSRCARLHGSAGGREA